MNTAIQELIHFIENDRMQSSYTKEQVIELLTFKLEKEKEQIMDAYKEGEDNVDNDGCLIDKDGCEQHYNRNFKSE